MRKVVEDQMLEQADLSDLLYHCVEPDSSYHMIGTSDSLQDVSYCRVRPGYLQLLGDMSSLKR